MPNLFDHEKLHVYHASLEFVERLATIQERIPKKSSVYDQLDRASISIPLNIAEGNGKFTHKDRCRFFDIARGSAFECAATLDILSVKKILEGHEIESGKKIFYKIVSMIVDGFVKSPNSLLRCIPRCFKVG